ncbi:MAG: hypothetical protein ACD_73C00153G0001 [uncultured bacterium]|nr:MAG: hypothetical protein ACD_73C00153G0001 [uncultured bacterium]
MVGGDAPDDGLAEIFQKLKKEASARGKNADNLSGMTFAAKLWMDKNPALYRQLAQYKLQPRVQECHEMTKGTPICEMTAATEPASPDLYLNMFKLLDEISKPANDKSLSYYVFDKARPACPFFGMHRGMVTFTLQDKCQ